MSFLREIQTSIIFSLLGRVSTPEAVPIYLRQSGTTIDQYINDGLVVNSIPVFDPAIEPDGSFFLQPGKVNECTYNLTLSHPEWIKGSSFNIQTDLAVAPDGTNKADRISVALGTGANNVLKRSFNLLPDKDYVVYQILKLRGGQSVADDVLRVSGDVVSNVEASYTSLNNYKDKYRIIELQFKTSGNAIDITNVQPGNTEFDPELITDPGLSSNIVITDVSSSTVTLEKVLSADDDLIGISVSFDSNPTQIYTITDNVKTGENNIVTVTPATLVADGVTTASLAALITDPVAVVDIETYITSAVTLDWGGMQVEAGLFRTSPIFQQGQKIARSHTDFRFRPDDNPIQGIGTFSLLIDLKTWRGDGFILKSGDFSISLFGGKLRIEAGGVFLNDTNELSENALILVAASAENSSLALYVDSILINRVALVNYTVSEGWLDFRTNGIRSYQSLTLFNRVFSDGQAENGEFVKDELQTIFASRGQDFLSVGNQFYGITLPPIEIDGVEQTGVASTIESVNTASNEVTLATGTGAQFPGSGLALVRRTIEDTTIEIRKLSIAGKSGDVLTLDSVTGITLGDEITTQFLYRPGKASVRLPFSAIETQEIEAIDLGNKKLTLDTVAAFEVGMRVIIQTPKFQDLGEYKVTEVDLPSTQITLNSVEGLSVGDLVSIPKSELSIPGQLYTVEFLQDTPGVRVIQKAQNGFVLENRNSEKREVHTQIRSPI